MAGVGNNLQRPTRCMNVYAKYRNEMSQVMRESQTGNINSQYGKHWYTNRNTGEMNTFNTAPNETWVLGRNLFKGETTNIKDKTKIIKKLNNKDELAKIHWDKFHNGNYLSIRDYVRKNNLNLSFITRLFHRISIYDKVFVGRSHNNGSKIEFVKIYE